MVFMELYDVMRSTPAVREFTDDPLPDDVLARILDNARFAPSGGNRQGVRVVVVRDKDTRAALADLTLAAARRWAAQLANGESPWNPLRPPGVDAATIAATDVGSASRCAGAAGDLPGSQRRGRHRPGPRSHRRDTRRVGVSVCVERIAGRAQ
jgi:nitroreductase